MGDSAQKWQERDLSIAHKLQERKSLTIRGKQVSTEVPLKAKYSIPATTNLERKDRKRKVFRPEKYDVFT